ncbi:MAG: SGNH/GDSL hydrolase family protein, partial [Clostridia bacterium]|nr:SGNH/GDSL hydrolase family protein [Clostridia bacterium]
MGDSITHGTGSSDPSERGYVSVFARQTGVSVCRNYGISGTRIARQQKPSEKPSYDQDFCSRVTGMDADADIVVV